MTDEPTEPTSPGDSAGEPVSFGQASPEAARASEPAPGADVDQEGPAPASGDPAPSPPEPEPAAPAAPTAEPAQPRGPLAQAPAEPGWWQASDGWWYPPEAQPAYATGYDTTGAAHPAPSGYPAGYLPPGVQPKSRVAAGILGILLGGLGVHRFYLGYTNIGIIQILVTVFTCGLGSIWGLVEGILILVKNDNFLTDANGVPLAD